MKYLSVCSGIEAATMAWHPLGWQPVAFSEIEPFPCKVLAHHYPGVPNLGDMTKFKEWNIEQPDLLVGGTPCQSFSVAGLRKGLDDPRGNLMLTYLAIADRFKPQWIVWENVPGVLSSNGGKDFGTFLGALGELGYGFAYRVLDAQFVRTDGYPHAVPQRRRRVFVVGCFGDWRRAAAVLFDSESMSGNPAPSRKAGQEVAGTIGARTTGGGGLGTDFELAGGLQAVACMSHGQANAEICEGYAPTLNCNHKQPIVYPINDMATRYKGTNGSGAQTGKGHGLGIGGPEAPMYTLTKGDKHAVAFSAGNSAGSRSIGYSEEHTPPLRAGASGTNMTPTIAYRTNAAGQVNPQDGIAAALNTQTDPCAQILHQSMQVRRLTPTECERLQAFPDGFTNIPGASDSARYKALGNSMAVNCMALLGERIQMVDDLVKARAR